MARPLKSELRDTRRDILDAALDLFAEGGFFGTSMRDIARAVGIRESAIYHHFHSKEAILQALLQELGPGRANTFTEIDVVSMARALGVKECLKQMVEFMVATWSTQQEQKILRLILSEGPRLGKEGILHPVVMIERARGMAAGLLQKLMKEGLIREVDPHAAVLALMGPLAVLRVTYLAMPSEAPDFLKLRGLLAKQIDFFWESIKPVNADQPRRRKS